MKKTVLLFSICCLFILSCTHSPEEKAKDGVATYLKENLKNKDSYEGISFSTLDTLSNEDTARNGVNLYKITHSYTVVNNSSDKVNVTATFYLDKDLNVTRPATRGIQGDYGSLSGYAIWEINAAAEKKTDEGAEATLYSLDTASKRKYTAIANAAGNFKINKIVPGKYFLVVHSKGAIDCPEWNILMLDIFFAQLKTAVGFDIRQYAAQVKEIKRLDSLYNSMVNTGDIMSFGGVQSLVTKFSAVRKEEREKAEALIASFPKSFAEEMKLKPQNSPACYYTILNIEENETKQEEINFGTNCY